MIVENSVCATTLSIEHTYMGIGTALTKMYREALKGVPDADMVIITVRKRDDEDGA